MRHEAFDTTHNNIADECISTAEAEKGNQLFDAPVQQYKDNSQNPITTAKGPTMASTASAAASSLVLAMALWTAPLPSTTFNNDWSAANAASPVVVESTTAAAKKPAAVVKKAEPPQAAALVKLQSVQSAVERASRSLDSVVQSASTAAGVSKKATAVASQASQAAATAKRAFLDSNDRLVQMKAAASSSSSSSKVPEKTILALQKKTGAFHSTAGEIYRWDEFSHFAILHIVFLNHFAADSRYERCVKCNDTQINSTFATITCVASFIVFFSLVSGLICSLSL